MTISRIIATVMVSVIIYGCGQKATVKEIRQTMKTYAYSDPDPIINPDNLYYPYYQFEGYTDVPQDKEWKIIELENEHIKLHIFPEIGGKIWGAIEKSTGKEFLYYNHSVKFRHVAMRGPWTSGGIEFNYGIIGHTPTTSAPIDYTTRTNDDGSVSCFIGSRELITNTDWCVEVKLEKDKAYFTTKTYWENPTGLNQAYYHWMNAGYKASDDLKFCFPGSNYIGHSGDLHSWPREDGREIDEYAKNDFGEYKSYHVLGKYANFYGAYWKNEDFGSVHHSSYDDKLGMKVWIWGLSRQGMIWENLLTDTDGQYVELQSGRMYNQPGTASMYSPFKHFSFEPYASDRWSEYWYPVKGTKNIVASNKYGALNVEREGGQLKLYLCPAEQLNTSISVISEGKTIYNEKINAKVLDTWSKTVAMDNVSAPVKVVLGDNLLVYSELEEENKLSRPLEIPADYDWNSLHGLYTQGKQWLNVRNFNKAESFFKQCLEREPMYAPALNDMAEICYRRMNFEEAVVYAKKSMSLNAYDPTANMIYGLSNSQVDRAIDAKDGFSVAAYTPSYRSAAYTELAKEFAKEQNWNKVKEYASKSLMVNPENITARNLMAFANRKSGNHMDASILLTETLEKLPLNHIAKFEKYMLSSNSSDEKDFLSYIKNELPHETMLAIADWYESMNAYDEALKVLSHAESYPISHYRMAYLTSKMNGKKEVVQNFIESAINKSPELVSPHGIQTTNALKWAYELQLKSGKKNWVTDYYLGLAMWSVGKKSEAKTLFDNCGNGVPFAPFFLCRAQLKEGAEQMADLQRAEAIDKSWRAGLRLINFTYNSGEFEKANAYAKEYIGLFPENYYIGLKYAQSMIPLGKYTECVDYLRKLKVLPNEGAILGRYVYRDACLLQAVTLAKNKDYEKALEWVESSKLWLENLGVGKPYDEDIDQRAEFFITAYCYKAMGKTSEAQGMYKKITDSKQPISSNSLLTAYAYRYLGDQAAANKVLENYGTASPSPKSEYVSAVFSGNIGKANEIIKRVGAATEEAAWENRSDNAYDLTVIRSIVDNLNN